MGITVRIEGNIYLDANIFIYLLEGYDEFTSILQQLISFIDSGKLHTFTSELSLAEVLVKPIRDNNFALQNLYESAVQTTSNLIVNPIDRNILIQAAKIEGKFNKQYHPLARCDSPSNCSIVSMQVFHH